MGRRATAYCRLFGHAEEWSSPDSRCARVWSCRRCGRVRSEQAHLWTVFEYTGVDRCDQERRCERCGATETRSLHVWGPWHYVGKDSPLVKLRQVRACRRCSVEEHQEFERAF